MTIISSMRASTLAVVLAAGALVGCSTPPSGMIASQQTVVPGGYQADTGPYSGAAWAAELDAAMTSDNGGGD